MATSKGSNAIKQWDAGKTSNARAFQTTSKNRNSLVKRDGTESEGAFDKESSKCNSVLGRGKGTGRKGRDASDTAKKSSAGSKRTGKSKGEHNQELGMRGEDAAARYLTRRGYDIVARNWTCFAGEADIVARDGNALVFVEVKTRSNFQKGMPEEAVGKAKRDRYEKIAAAFLHDYDAVDVSIRFDVISIMAVSPDRAMIRHHIDAFAAV